MAVKTDPFAGGEEQAAPAPVPQPTAQPGQPLGSLQMLVTLAAIDPEKERRRQMAENGKRGLDQLEALHAELVAGQLTPQRLEQLADWVRQAETPADPVLAGIMSEIELRVRVELAKLDIEI
ncbi:flagellar assembly protein FliX [Stakelama marina]|uniref:Flagellar assembly protein FliX n=1 Tax=Stakelama marina TaxID=2826939 RepID=A0A8T4ID86_9SPHN|nr:flagellar assembly protein FliX [Stakelama marina]MBR0550945.1 flagellar assembly protein FliX [Stakelama marina]